MIVRTVAFEKTIGMPNYSNDRPIVVEADLEPGETKEQAWTRMNQDMIAWHKKEYPHLYQETAGNYIPPPLNPSQSVAVIDYGKHDASPEGVLSDIKNVQTLEELIPYKLLAGQDKTTYSAYCQRLKELSI